MNDDLRAGELPGGPDILEWRQALDDVERSLRNASRAIALLRRSLEEGSPEPRVAASPLPQTATPASRPELRLAGAPPQERATPATPPEPRLAGDPPPPAEAPATPSEVGAPDGDGAGRSPFERLWDRMEAERIEKQRESLAEPSSERRGVDLLPHQYLVTVEDQESAVDLAPLQRALGGVAEMEDISLVSFANGVPVVSLRVVGELDLDRLKEAVSIAMDRACEVIPQDNGRLHLRLKSREDERGH